MSGLDGMTQHCCYCLRCSPVHWKTSETACVCGMNLRGQQTKDAPRAALPAEVEAALVDLVDEPDDHLAGRIMSASKIRAHLHHLTAEVERLRANGAAKLSTIHALCDTADEIERQARLDALRWVCSQAMCADWHDLGERIKAEIARLESNA